MSNIRVFSCFCFVTIVSGCGGTMQATIRGEDTPVQFQYEQGLDRDFYTATIDGENFSGQAIDAGARSGFGTAFNGSNFGNVIVSTSSGNFVSVLRGDMGSTMRCEMNYADSSGFTSFGGVGLCQMSDGRVIDVTW